MILSNHRIDNKTKLKIGIDVTTTFRLILSQFVSHLILWCFENKPFSNSKDCLIKIYLITQFQLNNNNDNYKTGCTCLMN